MKSRTLSALAAASLAALTSIQADWPQWRGPGGQGHAGDARLPAEWSDVKNVTWRTELPGRGWSSPVIVGNQIWVTAAHETLASEEEKKERLKENTGSQPLVVLSNVRIHSICIDKSNGKIVRDIPLLRKRNPQWVHKTNSYASPTPIIEDGRLYSHNGSYGSACLDLKSGEVLWTNQDLWVMHENGPGGSPILWNDLLIFHMDGSDRQFIAALEKKTGKLAWKTRRTGEMNKNPQLKKAYGTPVVTRVRGRDVVISPAADWLYGYDPATGEELWKVKYGSLGFSIVPKPVVADGMVYIGTSFMRPQLLAFDITKPKPEIAWACKRSVPAVSSPLLVGGEIYFVSDSGGIVTCLDAKTGKEQWRERIGGNHEASPTYAGGRLLFHSREGETAVLQPGRNFKVLARNRLDGEHHASAAVSGDALFLRTDKALYKIEGQ
ncbi:MAG: PQQ-binding-like beta-propeller repeat protein [Verrucomicrobiota bacterium]|nr:PQQ-binding-like beta-propeller repeat protein [Verrucomicrobiota bacterium]